MAQTAFRTEDELRESFVRNASPRIWSRSTPEQVCTRIESTCSDGRADWVWGALLSTWDRRVSKKTAHLLQQPTCSRILASLKADSFRSVEFVQRYAGVSTPTFRRYLRALIAAELISEVADGRYVLGPEFKLPSIEICSFEFKLENWRRAIYQSKRYRTFSHRVFVVMPPDSASRLNGSLDVLRRFNIGLLTHDASGETKRVIPSRKQPPSSRDSYLRALGMLFH